MAFQGFTVLRQRSLLFITTCSPVTGRGLHSAMTLVTGLAFWRQFHESFSARVVSQQLTPSCRNTHLGLEWGQGDIHSNCYSLLRKAFLSHFNQILVISPCDILYFLLLSHFFSLALIANMLCTFLFILFMGSPPPGHQLLVPVLLSDTCPLIGRWPALHRGEQMKGPPDPGRGACRALVWSVSVFWEFF